MNNENTTKSKKEIVIKIVIPVLILIVLAGIWFVKKNKSDDSGFRGLDNSEAVVSENPGAEVSENTESTSTNIPEKVGSDNPDFNLHVTEKIDLEKLKSYGIPIVIDFGSDSCIPCKQMAPVLKELNAELQGKAIIRFVDVWKNQSLADGYPISVIPTQIFIDANGKPFTPKDPGAMQMEMHKGENGEHAFTSHKGGVTKEQMLEVLKEMGLK